MKKGYTIILVVMLLLGFWFNVQSLAALVVYLSEEVVTDHSFTKRHFALQDAVSGGDEYYGYTEEPDHPPLEIVDSDVSDFKYMAVSPYYKVFFTGSTVKMVVQNAWIAFSLMEQGLGEVNATELMAEQNSLSVLNVFDSVDLSYEVDTSLLTETLTLRESKEFDRIIHKIVWEGMNPVYKEDGSILFLHGEKEILKILAPFMEDAVHNVCKDLHYEIVETDSGYELHKVIDEKGFKWLENAVYPVVLDPSIKTFEDAWQESGLTPYGQYFKNVKEYVNPANGLLTVTQTDLTIPGRGLDLKVARTYITPAIFYGSDPYDYEASPVDVGKGWQLNFPYVGTKYVHLWNGTFYMIEWSGMTFVNHTGDHFTLIKNGDNTYTLTTAGGKVYEFDTSGNITEIKDLDQNSITFNYTSGNLTSITDTIGRTVNLTYSNNRLWKIVYNNAEIEFFYDVNGCLQWTEDFLDRRTSYEYNTGYNNWLLSKIEYPTTGYTTYAYNRFSYTGYYKYYITNQRVYKESQVRHNAYSFSGSFSAVTFSTTTAKNEADITQGSYDFTISNGLVTQQVIKNASGTPIRKYNFSYTSNKQIKQEDVYYNGSTLSYSRYYAYDNWGNIIYYKNAKGHEKFLSYANTNTSGFFIDNTGAILKMFTNAFSNSYVPSSVHDAVIGIAEKQDNTYVHEKYFTYDLKAHPTQSKDSFGTTTTWETYSGTFNEYTGDTSFLIDLTGHTVTGNGVLKITGLQSDPTYTESHSGPCPGQCDRDCKSVSGSWQGGSFKLNYQCCIFDQTAGPPDYETCTDKPPMYIGPFTHKPGSLGYVNYYTTPGMGQKFSTFTVTTRWKAYPAQVQYNLDNSDWKTGSSNLSNGTANITVPISDGTHTLYFSESSSKQTKFSWWLYVPVDNSPDTYTNSA